MSDCQHCKELQDKLDYYQSRGQRMLDNTAKGIERALEDQEVPTASLIAAVTRFLQVQGLVDLRTGDTAVNHLDENYGPFEAPGTPQDDFDTPITEVS